MKIAHIARGGRKCGKAAFVFQARVGSAVERGRSRKGQVPSGRECYINLMSITNYFSSRLHSSIFSMLSGTYSQLCVNIEYRTTPTELNLCDSVTLWLACFLIYLPLRSAASFCNSWADKARSNTATPPIQPVKPTLRLLWITRPIVNGPPRFASFGV